MHGRARGGGCGQESAGEIGRCGCLCAGRDAADWVVPHGDVKSEDSHRLKAMVGARDQLVRAKRALGNQVRGLLRPFGIRLPPRQGTKKFAEAAHQAVRRDNMLHASVTALLEALAAIEGQIARLDEQLKELARRSPVCWRLMSVPGVGPIVAVEPNFQILRRHRRSLLLCLEHARRSAGENHVHRAPQLDSRRSLNLRIGIKPLRRCAVRYLIQIACAAAKGAVHKTNTNTPLTPEMTG